jgi:hypothetical protein
MLLRWPNLRKDLLLALFPMLYLVVGHRLRPLVHAVHHAILLSHGHGRPPQHIHAANKRWPSLNVLCTGSTYRGTGFPDLLNPSTPLMLLEALLLPHSCHLHKR